MSDVKKCDICGKTHDTNDVKTYPYGETDWELWLMNGVVDIAKHYDLCPECIDSFVKWKYGRMSKNEKT